MKKLLISIAVIILTLILLLYITCQIGLTPLLKPAIETAGTELTGTPVTIKKITANPIKGKLIITGLKIGNPKNFTGALIAEFDKIELYPDTPSLFNETTLIKKLFINSPRFSYEQNKETSNIEQFRRNIQAQAAKQTSPAKKIVIEHLLISGGQVTGKLTGMLLTVPIKPINKIDIGKQDSGISYDQIATELTTDILDNVIEAIEAASGKPVQTPVASTNKTETTPTDL